jgi:PAS domain S-box-containing protein
VTPDAPAFHRLPTWLNSLTAAWGGVFMVVALGLATFGFLRYERQEIDSQRLQQVELFARVLEDHATRTFNAADVALSAAADDWAQRGHGGSITSNPGDAASSARLNSAIQGMPFLRSLSVLDPSGRVLSSTNADNLGQQLSLARLGLDGGAQGPLTGTLVPGRDLAQAAGAGTPAASAPMRASFLPVARHLNDGQGLVVATLNPDFFANQHALMLDDSRRNAALLSYDGLLLSATDGVHRAPGTRNSMHPVFHGLLAKRESGSYIGPGIDGSDVVTAYRTARHRPLVLVVEQGHGDALYGFAVIRQRTLLASGLTALLIVGLMATAWRSLRGHESALAALSAAQQRVAHSEQEQRILIEGVQELMFRTDAAGRIEFVNARWSEMSGRPPSQAIGQQLSSLVVPAHGSRVDRLFEQARGGAAPPTQVDIEGADSGVVTLELSVAAVRNARGQPAGFAGFGVNVSQREQARQRLQAQLDFTALLIETTPSPVFVKNAAGQLVSVNRAWCDLMHIEPAAALGKTIGEVLPGLDRQKNAAKDREAVSTGEVQRYADRLLRADGEYRDTVITKVAFNNPDGSPGGVIGSVTDVTEFREAERASQRAAEAAESANRAKTEFVANISHELRTPLQSIMGFSELGMARAHEPARLNDMFNEIHAAGGRMLELVNHLLDLANVEIAGHRTQVVSCDLGALVREALGEFEPAAAARRVTLRLDAAPSAPPVSVAPRAMRQVLRHVLGNALRYTPLESEVTITARQTPSTMQLDVSDQGPGIPPGELDAIFEAFVQSSRTQDGAGGTGLGLAISRKLLQAMGGSIHARANAAAARGASFVITVPLADPGAGPHIAS